MVQSKAKYRDILWYYRWFALSVFVAVLAMGFIGVKCQPKIYGVSADIYVEPRSGTMIGDTSMIAANHDSWQINNQVEILGSDRVADKAADYLGKQLGPKFALNGRKLAKMITITKKDDSNVITLEMISSVNPHTLYTMIQEYLHAYQDALEMINSDKSSWERDYLAKQLDLAQVELDHSSTQIREFESKNAAYNVDTQVNQMLQTASALDEQSKLLNADIQATSAEILSTEKMLKVTPEYVNLMSIVERDPEAGELRKQILNLSVEKAESSAKVTEIHPKMAIYDRELDQLNQLLDQRLALFSGTLHGKPKNESLKVESLKSAPTPADSRVEHHLAEDLVRKQIRLDALRAKEKALLGAHAEVTEQLKAMPQQVVAYASLKNTYEMAQEKVKTLQERLDDASLMQEVSKRFTKMEVLKKPVLPTAPLRPSLLENMTAAALLGLGLSLFSVAARCAVDHTFRWPFQLNGLQEPNLYQLESNPGRKVFGDRLQHGTIGAPDAYKRLMVHLERLSQNDNVRRIGLLPVGGNAERGITGVTLALAMAEAGHKVALVDVDFTKQSITQLIEGLKLPIAATMSGGQGLSDYLSGATEDFVDIIYPLGKSVYGSFIPSGSPVTEAGLPVSCRSWDHLEESLSPNYNFVFYSLSSITQSYDAVAVSLAMDGVLLMVYPGLSMQDQIQSAMQELKTVGAQVLGIIIQPI